MDEELEQRLRTVERRLAEIASNTRTTWRELLLAGLLRGIGVVIGGALTVLLAGWGLAVLGVIPGAEEIAEYLSDAFSEVENTF